MTKLSQLRALLEKATPLQTWTIEPRGWADGSCAIRCGLHDDKGFEHHSEANARLLVAAVNVMEALLDCVEAARELREHAAHYQAKPGRGPQLYRAANRFDAALARLDEEER